MNRKVNLDAEVIRQIIDNNRPFLTPLATIFVGIILIIFFVIPQFNGFSAKQNEVEIEKLRLGRLQQSLSALTSTSDDTLNRDLQITSKALPPGKDFALILNAISSAASLSGVSLGDFDFQIGDITGGSQALGASVPSLKITINITGSVEATTRFIDEINKTVPISEVSGVKSGGSFSSVDIVFYYKPFPPKNNTDPESILPISNASQKLIDSFRIPVNAAASASL